MKILAVLILCLLPLPVFAQSAFETMVGSWRGTGNYVEGLVEVQLRCRVTIAGDRAAIQMTGRCASSLGGDDFTMEFQRGANGTAILQHGQSARAEDSAVDVLTGPLGANGLVVTGTAEGEEITVQLLLNEDGTLNFATREIVGGATTQSYVVLSRQ